MRMILVDHARSKGRAKRGSGAERVALDDVVLFAPERGEDVLAIDEALERLAAAFASPKARASKCVETPTPFQSPQFWRARKHNEHDQFWRKYFDARQPQRSTERQAAVLAAGSLTRPSAA
jgi:hypothetical protein